MPSPIEVVKWAARPTHATQALHFGSNMKKVEAMAAERDRTERSHAATVRAFETQLRNLKVRPQHLPPPSVLPTPLFSLRIGAHPQHGDTVGGPGGCGGSLGRSAAVGEGRRGRVGGGEHGAAAPAAKRERGPPRGVAPRAFAANPHYSTVQAAWARGWGVRGGWLLRSPRRY